MAKHIKVKPGKAQSMMGFFVGIVFCLIGLVVVIPAVGAFGLIWTAMAVIITAANGINAFSGRGISSHEIIIDDEEDGRTGGERRTEDRGHPRTEEREPSIGQRLKTAEDLYRTGMITGEEYEEKRKEILKDL